MSVLTEYLVAKNRFYEYFKYKGWTYGIEDQTASYWKIIDQEVEWCDKKWSDGEWEDEEYSNEIVKVYRTDDLTMILVENYNRENYLQVFDNTKEIKE